MRTPKNKGKGFAYQFLTDHLLDADGPCLIWPLYRDPDSGYGRGGHLGEPFHAHRKMCEMVNGPPPTDIHEASHSCGRGHEGCVHPKHLSWKTPSENQLDRRKHGTAVTSTWGNRGKLTEEQKQEIRSLKGAATQRDLAAKFGVHFETISRIHRSAPKLRKNRLPFTRDEILAIRRIGRTKSLPDLARMFNSNISAIRRVRYGQTYSDIR